MRDFAKAFYLSKEWRAARDYIFNRDSGLCVSCGNVGEIVHHKIHLSPQNISDQFISLGEENLELLCRDCHGAEHATQLAAGKEFKFDENGNLVERFIKL